MRERVIAVVQACLPDYLSGDGGSQRSLHFNKATQKLALETKVVPPLRVPLLCPS